MRYVKGERNKEVAGAKDTMELWGSMGDVERGGYGAWEVGVWAGGDSEERREELSI